MANEVYYSGLGDLRLAATLHRELGLLLADRASIWGNPAIVNYGDAAGSGSTVHEIGLAGLDGYDEMASVAENASASNTALTDASPNLTIARQAIQRQISDLAALTDSVGLNPARLAASVVGEAAMRFTSMIANITDDFTATAGATGVDLSLANWQSAIATLIQADVPGPWMALLHPVQFTDLQSSVIASGNVIEHRDDISKLINIKGPGFKGSLLGVDIHTSSKVPTANAGADRAGGMWGVGAVGYREGSVRNIPGLPEIQYRGPIKVEFERDASGALTKIVGDYYVGVGIIEDSRGVSIITDA